VSLIKHHTFMWGFSKRFLVSLKRPVFAYLATLSLTSILLFSAAFHAVEGSGINPNIHEFFDSVYYGVTVTTGVGLGDIAPVTRLGKLLTLFMMLLSTALFVSFSGILAASILEVEMDHLKDRER
jgi:voltage-gated potassium channel